MNDLHDVETRMQQAKVATTLSEIPAELRKTINRIEQSRDEIVMLKRYIQMMPMPLYFRGMLSSTVDLLAWISTSGQNLT